MATLVWFGLVSCLCSAWLGVLVGLDFLTRIGLLKDFILCHHCKGSWNEQREQFDKDGLDTLIGFIFCFALFLGSAWLDLAVMVQLAGLVNLACIGFLTGFGIFLDFGIGWDLFFVWLL